MRDRGQWWLVLSLYFSFVTILPLWVAVSAFLSVDGAKLCSEGRVMKFHFNSPHLVLVEGGVVHKYDLPSDVLSFNKRISMSRFEVREGQWVQYCYFRYGPFGQVMITDLKSDNHHVVSEKWAVGAVKAEMGILSVVILNFFSYTFLYFYYLKLRG